MLADGEKKEYVCDDVEYRYSESTKMLYIWLSNDDRYYKQPKRADRLPSGKRKDASEEASFRVKQKISSQPSPSTRREQPARR